MADPALPQKLETTLRLQNEGAQRDNSPSLVPARSPAIPPRRSPPPSLVGADPRAEFPIAPLRPPLRSSPATSSPVLHPRPDPLAVPAALSEVEANLLSRAQVPGDFGDFPGQPSPRKETARVAVLPTPLRPPATVQLASGTFATSRTIDAFDSIPRWFCWGLLGLSALIFLIQIWNYALS
jgi:hypothetical protein